MRKKRRRFRETALPENLVKSVNTAVILLWVTSLVMIIVILLFSQLGLRNVVDFVSAAQWNRLRWINITVYIVFSIIAALSTSLILFRFGTTRTSEKEIRKSKVELVIRVQVVIYLFAAVSLGVFTFLLSEKAAWIDLSLFHLLRLGIIFVINIFFTIMAMSKSGRKRVGRSTLKHKKDRESEEI